MLELNTAVILPKGADIYEFAVQITGEIMERFEKPLLKKITEAEFSFSPPSERAEILNIALRHASVKNGDALDNIHYERRKALIREQAEEYLRENNYIIINGFVNFRLEDYKNELKNLCHDAAEELYAMREYDEFLNMLSFFISVQSPKENLVHIVKKDGILRILNKRHKDITNHYCEEAIFSGEDFGAEDIVLSALITIAPRKIMIHDKKENERIYDTIASVFPDVEFTESVK